VLVCPAQFCVPEDYNDLFDNLSQWQQAGKEESSGSSEIEIATCRVAPLPRTEWIKVARQLPTRAFFEGRLPVVETLSWYFDAIEEALADIFAKEGGDVNICVVGHSIGGWVARAYLGGLSRSSTSVHRLALERCSSLITLGTPHISPADVLVDQTRGLLTAIEESPECHPKALADKGIDITCVGSSGIGGSFFSPDIEKIIAASSYFPFLGKLDLSNVKGDGIVPLELAFLEEPARKLEVETCTTTDAPVRHSHVVPTPWNLIDGYSPSIRLPDETFPSYISEGVVHQWAKYIS
jgi:pimeloyl-ACP methyl ester carboxylesterase